MSGSRGCCAVADVRPRAERRPRVTRRRRQGPGYPDTELIEARAHCARGAGVWEWAGTENGVE
ncbi:hypothetical protein, partial [Streptomyces sp. NPDC006333]|uniref:hypothetical protein n=1 Tax=Streptomyces sp. NPDC006333 TaxID=3156753 RepID=UPI0033AE5B52